MNDDIVLTSGTSKSLRWVDIEEQVESPARTAKIEKIVGRFIGKSHYTNKKKK